MASVRIAYGGGTPTTGAVYFASWIGQALPSAPTRFESTEGQPGLRSVTFSSAKGDLVITHTPPQCIQVEGLGLSFRTSLPPQDEASLMREELKILGPDRPFMKVLR